MGEGEEEVENPREIWTNCAREANEKQVQKQQRGKGNLSDIVCSSGGSMMGWKDNRVLYVAVVHI